MFRSFVLASISVLAACGFVAGSAAAPADWTYRGRVLDRETLLPVAGVEVRRFDGKVAVATNETGLFEFPMTEDAFGACHRSGNSVSCSNDDPKRATFFLRGTNTSPMLVSPPKYRAWDRTAPLLVWRRATLRGVCLDAAGAPLAGRELELRSERVLPIEYESESEFADLRATTGAHGEFSFAAIAANVRWSIHAVGEDASFVAFDAAPFALRPGEVRELTLRSLPETTIRGIVRDAAGKPRRGAAVWLTHADGFLNVDSGSDGSFAFHRVSAGQYELRALYPQSYDRVREGLAIQIDVLGTEREQQADLQLRPTGEISGRVLDANRKVVDDAEIWYAPETMPYSGRVDAADDGSFRLPQLLAGSCRLLASGPNRTAHSALRTIETGASAVELLLEPTGQIAGRVRSTALEEREKIRIEAKRVTPRVRDRVFEPGDGSFYVQLERGQETFAIGHMPAGRWLVQASVDDRVISAEQLVTVDVDKTTTCADFVLSPPATLWFVARPGIGDLEIEVRDEHDVVLFTRLAEGFVEIARVPAGNLHVRARAPGVSLAEQLVVASANEQQFIGFGFGD